jgi:hypothetical protein
MNSENPLLKDTGCGLTITYKGKYLYSSKSPKAAVLKHLALTRLLPRTLVFIPSIGLGYGFRELLERLPEHCHVLCVEFDEALMRLAAEQAAPFLPDDPRLTIVRADNPAPVQEILERLRPASFRRVVTLTLCGGARLYPDFYKKVEEYLRREVNSYWQNKMTLIHMGTIYVKNLIANLSLIPQARDLSSLAVHKPLLVVGAGPSLSASLPLINKLKERMAILAVDTALPVLLGSALRPDFIFALEPQFININDFHCLTDEAIPIIADLSSSPQVLRYCLLAKGLPLYLFSSQFHSLAILERLSAQGLLPEPVPALGSVGVAAVYAALRMTGQPIFLAGLDFSYPFSKTHARGAPLSLYELYTSNRFQGLGQREYSFLVERPRLTLKDKQGRKLESDLVLSSYAENLKQLSAQAQRVFDLNPLGIATGTPLVTKESEIDEILARRSAQAATQTAAEHPQWERSAVRQALETEKELLRKGIALVEKIISEEKTDAGSLAPEEYSILAGIDYTYFHLPSENTLPEYTKIFLAQVLAHARYFQERIERTLTQA